LLTPKIFQLFDSALPIGSFNHSLGVEEAYMKGFNVKEFIKDIFENLILRGDVAIVRFAYENPEDADEIIFASKLPKEIREASVNLGLSLASLRICNHPYIEKVLRGEAKGTYPVVVAVCCKAFNISVEDCMAGLAYSELAMLVFSAVRLKAINFVEGQKLISELLEEFRTDYEFEPFFPILDIIEKDHEKREPKVFLS
jgi:urease accessory protein